MFTTPIKEFKLKETKLTILKSLGKGGFAEVYLAQDNNAKKLYALKKIKEANLDSKSKSYLYNDIKILSRLNQQNIIKLYNTMKDIKSPNILYLLLEYCDGSHYMKLYINILIKIILLFQKKLFRK